MWHKVTHVVAGRGGSKACAIMHIFTHTHTHSHTCIHKHSLTHTHPYTHTYTHTCPPSCAFLQYLSHDDDPSVSAEAAAAAAEANANIAAAAGRDESSMHAKDDIMAHANGIGGTLPADGLDGWVLEHPTYFMSVMTFVHA